MERDERHRLWLELNCDPSAEAVTVPKESEMKGKTLPSMPFPWGNPLVYPVPGLVKIFRSDFCLSANTLTKASRKRIQS